MGLAVVGVKLIVEGANSFNDAFQRSSSAVGAFSRGVSDGTSILRSFNEAMRDPELKLRNLDERIRAATASWMLHSAELKRMKTEYANATEVTAKMAEAIERKRIQVMRDEDAMRKLSLQARVLAQEFGAGSGTLDRTSKALIVLGQAATFLGPIFSAIGRTLSSISKTFFDFIGTLAKVGVSFAKLGVDAAKALGHMAVDAMHSARNVTDHLHGMVKGFLGLGEHAGNAAKTVVSGFQKMLDIAGGMLIRDAIHGIIDGIKGLASGTLEAVSSFQQLEIQFEGLFARQIANQYNLDNMVEKSTTTWVNGYEIQGGATAEQALAIQRLTGNIQENQLRMQELIATGKEGSSQYLTASNNVSEYSAQLAILNSEVTQGTEVAGHFSTTMQMVAGDTMTTAEAMRYASKPAQEFLEWVKEIAVTTPFSVESLAKVSAMGMAMSFTSDEVKKLTLATGNFTAGMGLTEYHLERIMYNFAQMQAAGKVTGRELRDLATSMFPVNTVLDRMTENWNKNNKGMQMTREEMRELAAKGGVDVKLFFEAFMEVAEEDFPNAMERMSRTWAGVSSNVKDFIHSVLGVEVLGPIVQKFTDGAADGLNQLMRPGIRKAFSLLGDTIAHAFDLAARAFAPLTVVFSAFWNFFAGSLDKGASIIGAFSYAVTEVFGARAGRAVRGFAESIAWVIGIFTTNLGIGMGVIDSFAAVLFKVFGYDAEKTFRDFLAMGTEAFNAVQTAISTAISTIIQAVRDNLPAIKDTITTVFGSARTILAAFGTFLTTVLGPAFSRVSGTVTEDWPTMSELIADVLQGIRDAATRLTDWITGTLIPKLTEVVTTAEREWPAFKLKAEEVFEGAKEVWDNTIVKMYDWIVTNGPEIKSALLGALASVEFLSGLGRVYTAINAIASPLGFILTLSGLIGTAWETNWGNIRQAVGSAAGDIQSTLGSLVDFIQKDVLPLISDILSGNVASSGGEPADSHSRGGAGFNSMTQGIKDAAAGIREFVQKDLIPALQEGIDWVRDNWAEIGKAIQDGLALARGTFDFIVKNGPAIIAVFAAIGAAGAAFSALGTALSIIGPMIPSLVALGPVLAGIAAGAGGTGALAGLGVVLTTLGTVLAPVIGTLVAVAAAVAVVVLALWAIDAALQSLTGKGLLDIFAEALVGLRDVLSTAFTDAWNGISESFASGEFDAGTLGENIGAALRNAIIGVDSWLTNGAKDVAEAIKKWWDEIDWNDLMNITPGEWGELGTSMKDGLVNGLQTAFESNPFVNLVEMIIGFFKGLFGIASPSTVMAGIGISLAQGLVEGFSTVVGLMMTAATEFLVGLLVTFQTKITELQVWWDTTWDTIKTTAETIWNTFWVNVQTALATASTTVQTTIETLKTEIVTKLTTLVADALVQWETFKTNATTKAQEIYDDVTTKTGELVTEVVADLTQLSTDAATWLGTILTTFQTKAQECIDAFTTLDWEGAGKGAIDAIALGIGNAVNGLVEKAKSAARQVLDGIDEVWNKNSPPKEFSDRGALAMQAMAMGIDAGTGLAVAAAQSAASAITAAFDANLAIDPPDFGNDPRFLGPPENGNTGQRGGGGGGVASDELRKKALMLKSQAEDRMNPIWMELQQAGMSAMDYVLSNIAGDLQAAGIDPAAFWASLTGRGGPSPNKLPPGGVPGPTPNGGGGGGGSSGGGSGTGTEPSFADSVALFADAVRMYAGAVGYNGSTVTPRVPPMADPPIVEDARYLGPPVTGTSGRVRQHQGPSQIMQAAASRVVNNQFDFSLQANYAERQSPVTIRDDVSALIAMAQV